MPPRAPISILILQIVILASMLNARIAEPAYSTKYPVAPLAEIFAMMYKIISFETTPFCKLPSILMRITLGFVCITHCAAKTISTSLVPIPNAIDPKAP